MTEIDYYSEEYFAANKIPPRSFADVDKRKWTLARAKWAVDQRKKSAQAESAAPSLPQPNKDFEDAIPELGTSIDIRAEEDDAISSIDMFTLYEHVTGKRANRKMNGGTNNYLQFCPTAGHDNTESEASWLDPVKGTWVCMGQCSDGGGRLDMFAAARGMNFGKSLKGTEYAKAKTEYLVELCGWERTADGRAKSPTQAKAEQAEFEEVIRINQAAAPKAEEDSSSTGTDNVVSLADRRAELQGPDTDGLPDLGSLDEILDHLPEGTPVHDYVKTYAVNGAPHEFDLFNGLMLVGMCGGPFLRGVGHRGPFNASFWQLRVAPPGSGKSQAKHSVNSILRLAELTWLSLKPAVQGDYGINRGVRPINPVSGESLVDSFAKAGEGESRYDVRDVTGWWALDEYASLSAKSQIRGSSLMSKLMDFDAVGRTEDDVIDNGEAMGRSSSYAHNPLLYVSANIPPNRIQKVIGEEGRDNGLVSRFDVISANHREEELSISTVEFVSDVDANRVREKFREVVDKYTQKMRADEGLEPGEALRIGVNTSAHKAYDRLYNRYAKPDDDAHSRFSLKALRYCLLFAMNSLHDEIMPEDVARAEWIMNFLERSTALLAKKVNTTKYTDLDERIMKAIEYWSSRSGAGKHDPTKPGKGYASRGQIEAIVKKAPQKYTAHEINNALKAIVEAGVVAEADPPKGSRGPQTKRYALVPDEAQPGYAGGK
ncbi:helicase [Gordonia phage Demosthenes]|uniref:DNA helicase n=1 Tax=Gordonia phage Demosthenes TaxID=1838067 RepID=A0A166Y6H0_9CAUD|nr:helicase [Gordonia phage Demosthenes]ANA85973.1 DNA helicase [Gordonia phage Demosthenes]